MIISIANQKGGVGKTTTAVSLAHGAALQGISVLLIDLDAQGNVADSLGMDAGAELYDWLIGREFKGVGFSTTNRHNLHVVRAERASTAELKNRLIAGGAGIMALADGIEDCRLQEVYDLIIMDCAPSVDVLQKAALVASDALLIPAKLDQFAIKGILEMSMTLTELGRRRTHCSIEGVIPTYYDQTTNETQRQLMALVSSSWAQMVYPVIPIDVKIREANRLGQTIWEYAPKTRALVDGYEPALNRLLELAR